MKATGDGQSARTPAGSGSSTPRSRINTTGKSSLHDLYRRVPRTNVDTGKSGARKSSRTWSSLSNRYDNRLRKDLNRIAPGGGEESRSPNVDKRPTDPAHKAPNTRTPDQPTARRISTNRPELEGRGKKRDGSRKDLDKDGDLRLREDRKLKPRSPGASNRYTSPEVRAKNDRHSTRQPGTDARLVGVTSSRRSSLPTDLRPNGDAVRYPGSNPASISCSPSGYYNGYANWYGHSLGLSFSFGYTPSWCRWGLYSYPYYYCSYWPRWYYNYSRGFGAYWNSCYPWYSYSSCWWPTSYYQPSVYVSHLYYGDVTYEDEDEGRYYESSYSGTSIAVHAGGSAGEPVSPVSEVSLADHHVALGDFYFKEARFQESAESYLRALAYAADDATIHFVLADALFAIGDYHYSAYMIGKGLRLDPELANADADKRTFYTDVEDFDAQMQTLRAYVAEKPYDVAAQTVLAYNLNFSAQREEAAQTFKRVLEIAPSNQVSQAFLAVIEAPRSETAPAAGKSPVKRTP